MRWIKMTALVALSLTPSSEARELTLEDFQPKPLPHSIFEDWNGRVPPDQFLRLVVASDDCELGISLDDQMLIAETLQAFGGLTSGPRGTYVLLGGRDDSLTPGYLAASFSLRIQSETWRVFWAERSQLEKALECKRLKSLID